MRSLLATFVLLALVSGCGGSSSEGTRTVTVTEPTTTQKAKPKPEPKPTRYGQLLAKGMTPQKAAQPLCSQYEKAFALAVNPVYDYMEHSSSALGDAYAASEYASNNGGYSGSSGDDLERNLSRLALKRLKVVTRPKVTKDMLENFVADSLFVCRLGAKLKEATATLEAAEDRSDAISELATNVPWYPEGWREQQDGLAYRFLDPSEFDCELSDSVCWRMEVIARDGCDSGLYAELQLQDSTGAATGYTNDALGSLNPGQLGRLTFSHYLAGGSSSGLRAELTDLNCY